MSYIQAWTEDKREMGVLSSLVNQYLSLKAASKSVSSPSMIFSFRKLPLTWEEY